MASCWYEGGVDHQQLQQFMTSSAWPVDMLQGAATGVPGSIPARWPRSATARSGSVSLPLPTPHRGAGLDPTSYEAEIERFARAGEWPAGWRPK
ncbi:hypothetical protein OG298_02785 [Streptomyces sp. NBC_01005]|uniref:hypothetical protein n=1 Tax=unclassified Streptomyces TaxID=2593676 RepID=UPI00386381A2|nr:hypothetical protein OG298_02785 [Streptomyces sp. NBC_01005]WTC92855.1 hypothetical protein OH736_02770 [Streptomyces sp. NBC_01650]